MQKIPDVDVLLLRFLILILESSHQDKVMLCSLLTTLSLFGFILPIFDSNSQSLSWCYEDISAKWATRAFVCFSASNFTRIKQQQQQQQRQISPNFRGKYLSHVLTLNLLLAACSLILPWHPGLSCFCLFKTKKKKHLSMRGQGRAAVPSANSLCSLDCLLSHPALQPLSCCLLLFGSWTQIPENVYSTVTFASFHALIWSAVDCLSVSLSASLEGKRWTSGIFWTLTKSLCALQAVQVQNSSL